MSAAPISSLAAVGVRERRSRADLALSPFHHSPLTTRHSSLLSRSENLFSPLCALRVSAPLCVLSFSSFFLTASQFPSLLP